MGVYEVGVPSCVLIREMLAQQTLDAALELLERCPRTVANNFQLTSADRTINVEVSPRHFLACDGATHGVDYLVHANTPLYNNDMVLTDTLTARLPSSQERCEALRAMVGKVPSNSPDFVQSLMTMLHTPPVLNSGSDGSGLQTLASVVMDSTTQTM